MNVNNAPVVEVDQLMLTASFDLVDACSAQCAQRSRRHSSPERRVKHFDALDDCVLDSGAQRGGGSFDFGKLRHAAARVRSCGC